MLSQSAQKNAARPPACTGTPIPQDLAFASSFGCVSRSFFARRCEFVTDRVASLSPPRVSKLWSPAPTLIILGAHSSPPVQIAAAPGRRRHICTMRRRRRSMRTSSRSPRSALHPCASELSSETPLATARRVISSIGSFLMENFLTTWPANVLAAAPFTRSRNM